MTQKNVMAVFFKIKMSQALRQPVFLVAGIVFDFVVGANYFFVNKFFEAGSTNLHSFFYSIHVFSIFLIPIFSFKTENDMVDNLLPLSTLELHLSRVVVCFAKYLIVLVPLLSVPLCVNFFGDIDISQVITGFAIIILYGAAVSALAVFADVLFANAILSFITTVAFIAFFCFSHLLIPVADNISFARHFDAASKGILDSRDLIFFDEAVPIFILGAAYLAEKKCGKKINDKNKVTVFLLVAIFVLVAFDSSRFYFRLDLTRDKKFSVSEYSRNLISKIDEPMLVTYYRTKNLARKYPVVTDIEEYLSAWCDGAKNISLEIIDADKVEAGVLAESGIVPQQTVATVAGKQIYETIYSGIAMEYAGKISSVPFILNSENLEYELAIRLDAKQNRHVMIVAANGMAVETEYSYVMPYLSANGFLCRAADVTAENFYDEVLSFDGILLVFGSHLFSDSAAAAVEQFVLRGGNAFFAVSPYFVNVAGDWSVTKEASPIFDVLKAFGFDFENNIVADESCVSILFASEDGGNRQLVPYNFWVAVEPQDRAKKGATIFWGSPIVTDKKNEMRVILTSSKKSVAVAENLNESNIGNLFDTNPFSENREFFAGNSERKPHVLVAEKIGGLNGFYDNVSVGNSHVVVASDQFLCANITMQYAGLADGDLRNLDFLVNELLRLANASELAELHNKPAANSTFYKITDANNFAKACRQTVVISVGVLALFYALLFVIAGAFRKKFLSSLL